MKWQVALAQMDSKDHPEDNLARAASLAARAKNRGADLIAFPEFMNYLPFERGKVFGEPPLGRSTQLLQRLAKEHSLMISAGSILTQCVERKPRNRSFFVDREGQLSGIYDKVHLFEGLDFRGEPFREADLYQAGDHLTVTQLEGIAVGTAICYDLRFPEPFRLMALAGARVVFVPGNFTWATGQYHLETLLRARAIEHGLFIVSSDQTGQKRHGKSYGHSMAFGPDGALLGKLEEEEGLLMVSLDFSHQQEVRRIMPLVAQNREDVYAEFRLRLSLERRSGLS
ncbi:hypothetical protein ABB02_01732 [Clostridiaceae bacterium JG1575]|nr:hypothetical protein ABB02_01732 [Clostridiaceae bacterium JG1575]